MTQRKTRSREGWTRVRFGDVVRLSGERCTDPLGAGIERYVGLEHLEPGDLRIRSCGNVADGVTFTNRFRPGQVLFGKRRAYQRKVAVADFDGICSSDIYVFEPSDDRLLPELLPFICQTDGFFEHALKTSAGSLSPRTNWTSLSDYEFDLPPAEEQRRITHVIEATRAVRESTSNAISSSRLARAALAKEAGEGRFGDCRIHRIDELVHRMQYGVSVRPEPAGGIPILRMGNLVDGIVDATDIKYAATSDINPERDL
jgi:type I restriction enzyme S subunit